MFERNVLFWLWHNAVGLHQRWAIVEDQAGLYDKADQGAQRYENAEDSVRFARIPLADVTLLSD